jgi:hypothetical protein
MLVNFRIVAEVNAATGAAFAIEECPRSMPVRLVWHARSSEASASKPEIPVASKVISRKRRLGQCSAKASCLGPPNDKKFESSLGRCEVGYMAVVEIESDIMVKGHEHYVFETKKMLENMPGN